MKKIFIGFIFVFLDFNLTLNNSRMGLIPDFLGYIIMLGGLVEMAEESAQFAKARPYASGMAVYTGILYFMDLFGISASLGMLSYLLAITATVVSLYISYTIVMGVIDIEERTGAFLNGARLKSVWKVLVVFSIVTYVSLFVPAVAIACLIASLIAGIYFLVVFNQSRNLYYGRTL